MKPFAGDIAPAVGIEILVRDVVNERTIRQGEARIVLRKYLAKEANRGQQLMWCQMLIAKHQDRTVDEAAIEPRSHGVIDGLGEINATDFRPGVLGKRNDRVVHQPVSIGRLGSVAHSPSEAS